MSRFTLIGLHVHVWPRPIVSHGLALGHVHLALRWHALGGRDGVIVATHRAMAAGGHIHRATGHVWGLVGAWTGTLHRHVIWPWKITAEIMTRIKKKPTIIWLTYLKWCWTVK